eukprot:scaffold52120_cov275-Isochrysis_galbana.AAC.1
MLSCGGATTVGRRRPGAVLEQLLRCRDRDIRKRYTLAATRRNSSVPCRPDDTPPPPSYSSPIPSPSSGRLLRRD